MSENFTNFYKMIRPKIKESLVEFNNELLKEKDNNIKENFKVFADLNENGKLIRGTLIALGYKITGATNIEYSIPLATSYELFETSILVHDDIIDNDNLRRGHITVPYYNIEKYKNYKGVEHQSNAIGLCIGDYGLIETNRIIINNYAKDKNFVKILKLCNDIVLDTIRGELIDVITPFEEKNNIFKGNLEETILNIYKYKTSHYTLVGPLSIGMTLGNASLDKIRDIEKFSLPLGIAFQIQDDLLGIFSDNEKIGKNIGSDIKEFKQILLYSYTKKTEYYNQLMKYYGKDNFDIEQVKRIFEKSGAKEYCINKMNELYEESLNYLNKIKWLADEDKEILKDLIFFLKERKK